MNNCQLVNDGFLMDFERFTELSNAKLENGMVSSKKLIIVTSMNTVSPVPGVDQTEET